MLKLRWYQENAVNAFWQFLNSSPGYPLIVMPTGSGKSLIIAEIFRQFLEFAPEKRVLNLVDTKELVQSNYQEFMRHTGGKFDTGINCAGLGRKETQNRALFASIHSVSNKAYELGQFHLVLIDECHMIPPSGEGRYRTFLDHARSINPSIFIGGLTATPYRLKQGLLIEGNGRIFTNICFNCNDYMRELISQGFLCEVRSKETETIFDTSSMRVRAGEFLISDAISVFDNATLTEKACQEAKAFFELKGLKSCLAFATSEEHGRHIKDAFNQLGLAAGFVHAKMRTEERDSKIKAFINGNLKVLVNIKILTKGFNHKPIDLILDLAATMSTALYVQKIGRGMRTAPGKEFCYVLDYAGNIKRHGPIDLIEVKAPIEGKQGQMPVKACPQCKLLVALSVMTCPECSYEWERQEKIATQASKDPLLSQQRETIVKEVVTDVEYRKHVKGENISFRVDYMQGFTVLASEWIQLEKPDGDWLRRKASQWWSKRSGWQREDTPYSVDEALMLANQENLLDEPQEILIDVSGKYTQIISYIFADEEEEAHKPMKMKEYIDVDADIPF